MQGQPDATSLERLHDIVLPPAPAAWPPAPGWIALLTLLLAAAFLLGLGYLRHLRRERYRRLALEELQREDDPAHWPALLRRTALAAFPRERITALSGGAWLEFLDATAGSDTFTAGPGRALNELAYRPDARRALSGPERAALQDAIAGWIRHHREER